MLRKHKSVIGNEESLPAAGRESDVGSNNFWVDQIGKNEFD